MHPLLRLDFVPATSNERILPPEQPIKASLISGFDRAATVLHILRVWEWTWPPMIIDKTVRRERERERGRTGKHTTANRHARSSPNQERFLVTLYSRWLYHKRLYWSVFSFCLTASASSCAALLNNLNTCNPIQYRTMAAQKIISL